MQTEDTEIAATIAELAAVLATIAQLADELIAELRDTSTQVTRPALADMCALAPHLGLRPGVPHTFASSQASVPDA